MSFRPDRRPTFDGRDGFERGGWTASHTDEELWRFLTSVFERADALLLGRRTWQIFEAGRVEFGPAG